MKLSISEFFWSENLASIFLRGGLIKKGFYLGVSRAVSIFVVVPFYPGRIVPRIK